MMWIFFFFFFFFISLKSFIFVNSFFLVDTMSTFLSSICPLVLYLIYAFIFFFLIFSEYFIYKFSFFFIVLFCVLSFFSVNSYEFLLFLELCVFPLSFLIIYLSKDLDKISSLLYMIFINLSGSVPFMIFSSILETSVFKTCYFLCNSLSFLAFFSFLLVLICKLPMFFFHFWLTKAHVSASGACSMILASLMLKLGSFGLYKFSSLFFFYSRSLLNLFTCFSLLSCAFFCFLMVRFFDIKHLIACSSILHMSMMVPLLLIYTTETVISSMYMMVGHGLVSYYLFLLVTILYESSNNRSVDFNKSLESLCKSTMLIFFVYIFLNMGVPPFLNFYSEMLTSLFFFDFSYVAFNFFFFVLLSNIMFTMFMTTKILFGKKVVYVLNSPSYIFNQISISYGFYILAAPFLV